jgi:hypothetical protein
MALFKQGIYDIMPWAITGPTMCLRFPAGKVPGIRKKPKQYLNKEDYGCWISPCSAFIATFFSKPGIRVWLSTHH